jgi:RNA polymerase sigma factor (TIGR02999 family)
MQFCCIVCAYKKGIKKLDYISQNQITQLLQDLSKGDKDALNKLLPIIYSQVKKIASRYLSNEYEKRTIQTTELVHEAYLKLFGQKKLSLENRKEFFGVVANVMRQILVDNARKRNATKRGNDKTKISLDKAAIIGSEYSQEILILNDALIKLDLFDKRLSSIVELRYFAGMTIAETAEILSVSPNTVKRDWTLAKAWLYKEIENEN